MCLGEPRRVPPTTPQIRDRVAATQGRMDSKSPKDVRKERLAKQLRANLQRRKTQARERAPETPDSENPDKPVNIADSADSDT